MFSDRRIGKPVSMILQNRGFCIGELVQVGTDRRNIILGKVAFNSNYK
jgi:hypothetical protein